MILNGMTGNWIFCLFMRSFLEKIFANLWHIVLGNLKLNIVLGPRGLTGEGKALDPGGDRTFRTLQN